MQNDQSLGTICNFHMTICLAGNYGWRMFANASHKEPLKTWSQCFSRQKTIKITPVHFFSCKIFIQTRIHTVFHTVLRKSVWFFIINIFLVIKNTLQVEIWPWRSLPQDPIEACAFGACLGRVSIYPRSAPVFMPYAEIFKIFLPGKDWSTKISQWNGHSPDELTLQMPLSKCFCNLRSRRLEVVGTRKNGRARRGHACLPRARPLSLSRTTSRRLLRRLVLLVMLNC